MTKEEIIKKYEPYPNKAEVNVIGVMMDEYAKQQAIAFEAWSRTMHRIGDNVVFGKTTEQLYDIFLKQQV